MPEPRSYGPARDWAHRVASMDPPEIFHRTAKAPDGTSIDDRRNALLDQVDGARAEYARNQAASASFTRQFPAYGQQVRPADGVRATGDGARPATGARVERAAGDSIKKD
jgi:hypothetical protein